MILRISFVVWITYILMVSTVSANEWVFIGTTDKGISMKFDSTSAKISYGGTAGKSVVAQWAFYNNDIPFYSQIGVISCDGTDYLVTAEMDIDQSGYFTNKRDYGFSNTREYIRRGSLIDELRIKACNKL